MKQLNNFIQEKLKLNKDFKYSNSKENWTITKAEDGDFVQWNGSALYFIYKCVDENDSDYIIFHAAYNFNLKDLSIGPSKGVGDNHKPKLFTLASEEKKEEFIKVLKKEGYEWDDDNKELIKVIKLH